MVYDFHNLFCCDISRYLYNYYNWDVDEKDPNDKILHRCSPNWSRYWARKINNFHLTALILSWAALQWQEREREDRGPKMFPVVPCSLQWWWVSPSLPLSPGLQTIISAWESSLSSPSSTLQQSFVLKTSLRVKISWTEILLILIPRTVMTTRNSHGQTDMLSY